MSIKEMNAEVPESISRIIKEKGLIVRVVAEKCGMKPEDLYATLQNRRILKPNEISKLAEVLGVKPNVFFEMETDSKSYEEV